MTINHCSRRAVLRSLLATGCALCLPSLGQAQAGKLSKQQALYQDRPNGDQNCGNCMYFTPPNSCQVVTGEVSANGWSRLWLKKAAPAPIGKL